MPQAPSHSGASDTDRTAGLLVRAAQAARLVHASLSPGDIARVLTEQAREIIGAHLACTLLSAEVVHASSVSSKHARWRSSAAGRCGAPVLGPSLPTSNHPLRLSQAELEERCPAAARGLLGGPPLRGLLSVPLTGHSGVRLGVVQLSDRYEGEFTAEDEAILVQLAAIASTGFENARLYASLREADRRKDEFIATLAHELRNPLAPIRNGLEILRRGGNLSGAPARARDTMERQLTHMVRLVDDLLDVSRISRGKVDLRREPITLQSVVENALETVRPALDAHGHVLTMRIARQPIWVHGDLTRLAQVLSNLLNNAIKYTHAGGRIDLSLRMQGDFACLRVSDNGIGIPAPMLPRVFEMFAQVDNTLARSQGGLGIGLCLVKTLVELHGGTIAAASRGEERGSRFTVLLPLAPSPALAARHPVPDPAPVHAPAWA